jgi:deoxyadenosine/deoxycytidine kinase
MLQYVEPPDLMIYLKVSPEEAIQRIKKRGRQFEIDNNLKYWYDLNQNYNNFFHEYKWSPLLVIEVDEIDFVNNEKDRLSLLEKIYV